MRGREGAQKALALIRGQELRQILHGVDACQNRLLQLKSVSFAPRALQDSDNDHTDDQRPEKKLPKKKRIVIHVSSPSAARPDRSPAHQLVRARGAASTQVVPRAR